MSKSYFSVDNCLLLGALPSGAKIHLIGVCGVGMAPLAVELSKAGYRVSGSDKEFYPPMSTLLEDSAVEIKRNYCSENITPDLSLVIIGNAVSIGHPEVRRVEELKLNYSIFPAIFSEFVIDQARSIVVTGTHGKSSTTAMIAYVLHKTGRNPGYFAGGMLSDLPTSLKRGAGSVSVVEGDEYDSSFFAKLPKFHFYRPDILIINGIEFDHADIYPSLDSIVAEFDKLVANLSPGGVIICCSDCPVVRSKLPTWRSLQSLKVITFGESDTADWRITEVKESNNLTCSSVVRNGTDNLKLGLKLPGVFNQRNGVAALIACREVGLQESSILEALSQFNGVRRRQEVRLDGRIVLVEDFAHHPSAVQATLSAMRARYPDRTIWAVFEPRSNTSRRKAFESEYIEALKLADKVVLSIVTPRAGESNDEIIDVAKLAESISAHGTPAHAFLEVDQICDLVAKDAKDSDVILVMSNGSFGGLIDKLLKVFS